MQIKKQLTKYALRRPRLMDLFKTIVLNLRRNRFYKPYALKAAQNYALKYPHGNNGISIETILNCNARCIMCAHAYKQLMGVMSMDLFKKIIKDCRSLSIKDVGLSVYGEPLMDPFLFERIHFLRKYNRVKFENRTDTEARDLLPLIEKQVKKGSTVCSEKKTVCQRRNQTK